MFDLILAVLSSTAVSAMLRIGEQKTKNMYARFAANYLCAAVLAILCMTSVQFQLDGSGLFALGLGAIQGVFYLLGLIVLQLNIRKNGVILSSTFAKLGVIVPVVFSVAAFAEYPSLAQLFGFLLACCAIWVIRAEKQADESVGSRFGLLILLLCSGFTDSLSKVFEELGSRALDAHFLLFTFIAAFLLSLFMMIFKKERPCWQDLLYGCLVGIPNYGSVFFLLRALTKLSAVLVYPCFSAGTIAAVSLVGFLFFHERPQKRQWAGLSLILVALVLLNL